MFAVEEEAATAYKEAAAARAQGHALPIRPARPTSSQYKGVSWSKGKGKWQASICDGKMKSLGHFPTEKEAAATYIQAVAAKARGDPMPTVLVPEPSSKHLGVYWKKQYGKWAAVIRANGKKNHLGYFVDEDEAAAACIRARKVRANLLHPKRLFGGPRDVCMCV
jgi:hypothetical protein